MPDLIALKSMRYRRRALRPGDRFSVGTDVEAYMMRQMGNAADAEPAPAPAPEPPAAKRKPGRYKRRDLRAED